MGLYWSGINFNLSNFVKQDTLKGGAYVFNYMLEQDSNTKVAIELPTRKMFAKNDWKLIIPSLNL